MKLEINELRNIYNSLPRIEKAEFEQLLFKKFGDKIVNEIIGEIE